MVCGRYKHFRVADGTHLLTTAEGTIHVTAEHPFYLHNKGWLAAEDLMRGDVISTIYGTATIYDNQFQSEAARVYNLTVDHGKTYFVLPENSGDIADAMWVHNAGRQSCWGANDLISPPRRHGNRNLYEAEVDVTYPDGSVRRETRTVYIADNGRYTDFEAHPPEQRLRPDVYLEPPEGHHWVRNQDGTVTLNPNANYNGQRMQPNAEGTGFEPRDNPNPVIHSRTDAEYEDLARDPDHADGISDKTIREREVGIEMERAGVLEGPIRRDPTGAGEFIDANGVTWDVKQFNSNYPPRSGGFDVATDAGKVDWELSLGENVILDTKNLSPSAVQALRQEAITRGWGDRVIFW